MNGAGSSMEQECCRNVTYEYTEAMPTKLEYRSQIWFGNNQVQIIIRRPRSIDTPGYDNVRVI
jgi:hypothetical protein